MEPGNGSQLPPYPQDQEASKFIIDAVDVLLDQSKPLPDVYGDNRAARGRVAELARCDRAERPTRLPTGGRNANHAAGECDPNH